MRIRGRDLDVRETEIKADAEYAGITPASTAASRSTKYSAGIQPPTPATVSSISQSTTARSASAASAPASSADL